MNCAYWRGHMTIGGLPSPHSLTGFLRYLKNVSQHCPVSWMASTYSIGQEMVSVFFAIKIYRHIKRRVGCSLKRTHCKGNLVSSRKQVTHKYLELNTVFLALKEFQDLCSNNIVLVATDNTTVVAYINKGGGGG